MPASRAEDLQCHRVVVAAFEDRARPLHTPSLVPLAEVLPAGSMRSSPTRRPARKEERSAARSRLASLDAAILPRGGRSVRAKDATRQTRPRSVAPANHGAGEAAWRARAGGARDRPTRLPAGVHGCDQPAGCRRILGRHQLHRHGRALHLLCDVLHGPRRPQTPSSGQSVRAGAAARASCAPRLLHVQHGTGLEDHTEISALSFIIHNSVLGLADCRCRRPPLLIHAPTAWRMSLRGKRGRHSNESVTGHICGCVSFENGKIANFICRVVKLQSPLFIMVESPFS
jgi:hypothetical protein